MKMCSNLSLSIRGFATPLGVATPLLVFTSRQDRPSEAGDHLHREKLSIPCRGNST